MELLIGWRELCFGMPMGIFFETFGHQIPVKIAEELMIEAKETIKVR
jgi:hypothetical protein